MKNLLILAAIIALAVFVDWDALLSKFQSGPSGPPVLEVNSLTCNVMQGEGHTSGLSRPRHAAVSGSVTNISEKPLKVTAKIKYLWQDKTLEMSGKRTTRVNPYPLEPDETGTFSHTQYDVPEEIDCVMSFEDTMTGSPIPFRGQLKASSY
jgi:hypothetical protein